jgi:hypothetical protein
MNSPLKSLASHALAVGLGLSVSACTPAAPRGSNAPGPGPAEAAAGVGPARVAQGSKVRRSVVLVAIDGVRWQDVFEGVDPALAEKFHVPAEERVDAARLLPNLHRLMTTEGAAIGGPGADHPMEASGPNFVSLPGYTEMLTGRADTGCTDNQCARTELPTVADEVARGGLGEAVVVASWPVIARAATAFSDGVTLSVGRHEGPGRALLAHDATVGPLIEAGERSQPEPGNGDFRPDNHTAKVALACLTTRAPEFLFVGLGDTDEYGHQEDYRGYLRALREADAVVGDLFRAVSALNARGQPSTLLVTTDHGRSREFDTHGQEHPESSRVWLVAAGAGVEARGLIGSPRSRHLSDVGQTIRRLIGLPPVVAPTAGDVMTELGGGLLAGRTAAELAGL